MAFPEHRFRRLRANPTLRRMIRETRWSVDQLICPLFVRPGSGVRHPICSMPGQFQFSPDTLVEECREVWKLGIPAVLLFGIPDKKDAVGSASCEEGGIVQRAVAEIKTACPELVVITDVCLCEYTDHGHCGVVADRAGRREIDNDATLPLLVKQAVSHARAGADIVAPSDMMDGRVGAIRAGLDAVGLVNVPIMAYAAKFASSFYGPFREAAESPPMFGDRKTYQMDFANAEEALREVAADIEEGADLVMVKPAVHYLDLIWRVKQRFGLPTVAYHVSGEYAAIKAAAANGWIDEKGAAIEATTAIVRAGADLIITYYARDLACWANG
ncbi:MAG TPA: porphobilinogen synthase [Phycisphaerae bacterium]|nr:porphobilinogen synthase [Phycisphaerae bacterium]